jgi:hypothetical protein
VSRTDNGPRIPAGLTGDFSTELADQAVGPDPDPLMPDARRLLPFHDFVRFPPSQTLDDQGTQAEEQSQQAGIDPRQIHLTPRSRLFDHVVASRTNTPIIGNMHARH